MLTKVPTTASTNIKLPTLDLKLNDVTNYSEWAEEMDMYLTINVWDNAIKGTKTDIKKKMMARGFIVHDTEGSAKSLTLMGKTQQMLGTSRKSSTNW